MALRQHRAVRLHSGGPGTEATAQSTSPAFRVRERYGWVWVCLGKPEHDIPVIPEWDDASFRNVLWGPRAVPAAGPRLVENFLDIAHFPYVHEGYLGDLDHTAIDDYTATLDAGRAGDK